MWDCPFYGNDGVGIVDPRVIMKTRHASDSDEVRRRPMP
jgi:hypothetical protein